MQTRRRQVWNPGPGKAGRRVDEQEEREVGSATTDLGGWQVRTAPYWRGSPCGGRGSRTCKSGASYRFLATSLNCPSGVDLPTGVFLLVFPVQRAQSERGCRSAGRRTRKGRRCWHQEAPPCQRKSSVDLELDNFAELLSL